MTSVWRDRLILLSPFAVIAALALAPLVEDGPTICPFALCTGIACPGCGMTRAATRLVRGDFGAALTFHPLIPAVALVSIGGWAWFMMRRAGRVPPMSRALINRILIVIAIALVGVWIARLLTGTLPAV
jgi:hypothetical protein